MGERVTQKQLDQAAQVATDRDVTIVIEAGPKVYKSCQPGKAIR